MVYNFLHSLFRYPGCGRTMRNFGRDFICGRCGSVARSLMKSSSLDHSLIVLLKCRIRRFSILIVRHGVLLAIFLLHQLSVVMLKFRIREARQMGKVGKSSGKYYSKNFRKVQRVLFTFTSPRDRCWEWSQMSQSWHEACQWSKSLLLLVSCMG